MRDKIQIWRSLPLGQLAKIQSGGTPDRKNSAYWEGGTIPWVTTAEVNYSTILKSNEKITELGLKNSAAKIFSKNTILIALYGQGVTRGKVGILGIDAATNQACAAIQPKNGLDTWFVYQCLRGSYDSIRSLSNTGGQDNLSAGIVSEIQIPLPPLIEQRKIAAILQTWDYAIEKLEALRIAGERQYSGLADDLIFGRRRNIGARRNWRHRRLGDVTREVTARNVGGRLGRDAVMGVTKANGIVPMRDQTIGADLSRYKVLPPLGFAYNPMRINIGSIALSTLESDVLVSPDYVLFICEKGKLSPDYLEHLRKTHFWAHHINAGGAGSVRLRIYYDDFAALNLPLPDYDEQLAIVEVLDAARRQIDLTETEVDLLSRQKRGLMQKLLTGEWRVKI